MGFLCRTEINRGSTPEPYCFIKRARRLEPSYHPYFCYYLDLTDGVLQAILAKFPLKGQGVGVELALLLIQTYSEKLLHQ